MRDMLRALEAGYLYNAIKRQLLKKETWKRNMNLQSKMQQ